MIGLMGTGAVATFLAERFQRHGIDFFIFGSPSERLKALANRFGQDRCFHLASSIPGGASWVVVTKTWQNRHKISQLKEVPKPSRILVLQNGWRPEVEWSEEFDCPVERGVSTYGVKTEGPGLVKLSGEGELVLGRASEFAPIFRGAKLAVSEDADLSRLVWHKLAVNSSLNVVCALYGLKNGQLLHHPAARSLARTVASEVRVVAEARGVRWGSRGAWDITKGVAESTADNICSTLADLWNGRPTEYESINGAVLRLADEIDLPVPTLLALDRRFRRLLGTTSPIREVLTQV